MNDSSLSERYQESSVSNDRTDWILIKDRATGKVILVHADNREGCLLVLRSMNLADKLIERIIA